MPFYHFYPEVEIPHKEINNKSHPWEKHIKDCYTGTYKYGHNSTNNPIYPPPKKGRVPSPDRLQFTVVGTSTSKGFIYCMNLVKGLHKYRWRHFDAPIIKAVTSVEWPQHWQYLKIRYGGLAYCLQSPVAVIINEQFIGGEEELKKLIESKYIYYIRPDYYVEAVNRMTQYLNSSARPSASLEIMIADKEIGSLIFMLYSDIVPRTCENFLRLCKETKGGYSGTPIHRVVKDSWIQGGGFGLKNSDLDCENFIVPHDRRGVIAMANDGRHVDCSTQFFVLLQPQDWMAHKYVAFGQLISGEYTLKEIEKVPTWYESPEKDIIIKKASIINLECQDLRINKGTNKYLEAHIENLLAVGAIFYEEILEKVFLEVEFRNLQRIEEEMIEPAAETTDFAPDEAPNNLRTTARFMRNKEEIDRQILGKSQSDRGGKTTPATVVDKAENPENNDFDVEEYEYVPEEYSYKHVSTASGSATEPEKPYIIPFTDVPYPGEVNSEFDLKRLLQGHYCLESDIDQEASNIKKKPVAFQVQQHPEILKELFDSASESLSVKSWNWDDERDIAMYLNGNTDRVSFAGDVVKTLARRGKLINIFEPQNATELITDETLRKLRLAEEKLLHETEKVVTEELGYLEHKEKIRRKQTGFLRPEDLARIRQLADEDEEADHDNDKDVHQPFNRRMSNRDLAKRDSATVSQQELYDVYNSKPSYETLDGNEEEIDERIKPRGAKFEALRRTHFIHKDDEEENKDAKQQDSFNDDVIEAVSNIRYGKVGNQPTSALSQLCDDMAVYDGSPGPTLKNYIPLPDKKREESVHLITFSEHKQQNLRHSSKIYHEMYLKRRHSAIRPDVAIDKVLFLQHGQSVYRKISTDYVRTIDQIEQVGDISIRAVEYAQLRPAITVLDYQKKNREFRKSLSSHSKLSKDTATVKKNKQGIARSQDEMPRSY